MRYKLLFHVISEKVGDYILHLGHVLPALFRLHQIILARYLKAHEICM
jgi:hypothetical protein